jgi:hypothetical protein
MPGKWKNIITGLLLLAIISGAAGYYIWNKPHKDVAAVKGTSIEATALYQAFITDSATANKKYYQQVLNVTGAITNISKNLQNQTVATLKTNTESAFINCTMEGNTDGIKQGSTATIKGVCQGIQGDAELGILGDVYMVRCYIVK